jgi:hypothetical protein
MEYTLIFVKDKDEWGFYGLYWNKDDFKDRLEYVKKTFKDFKSVNGKLDITSSSREQ